MLLMEEERVETDDGELRRRTASTLIPRWEEGFKSSRLIEHVQLAIDSFPGHTFSGRFDCEGEDNTDLWRVLIRDGRAVRVEPRIVWPDEEV